MYSMIQNKNLLFVVVVYAVHPPQDVVAGNVVMKLLIPAVFVTSPVTVMDVTFTVTTLEFVPSVFLAVVMIRNHSSNEAVVGAN